MLSSSDNVMQFFFKWKGGEEREIRVHCTCQITANKYHRHDPILCINFKGVTLASEG